MGQALLPNQLAKLAKGIYRNVPNTRVRVLQGLRPYICPFDDVLTQLPRDSAVLDVGCGAGLFLLLSLKLDLIKDGYGFDVAQPAIAAANAAAANSSLSDRARFEARSIADGIPKTNRDVITCIDVIHHVPRSAQEQFITEMCETLPAGGRLILKDMVTEPRWRAYANQLHDLVMVGERINHVDPQTVARWARKAGCVPVYENQINMLWYGHWTLVLRRQH